MGNIDGISHLAITVLQKFENGKYSFVEARTKIHELMLGAETVREVDILHKIKDRIVRLESETKIR